jgi:GNAT superfamily N-acetyltransferase
MTALVRLATPDDETGLLALWSALTEEGTNADPRYRPRPDANDRMARRIAENWLTSQTASRVGFRITALAEQDGAPVGFMAAHAAPEHALIAVRSTVTVTDAYVAGACRRQGIGRALFAAVRNSAASVGLTSIEVGTLALDGRAVQFWTRLGFGPWRVTLRMEG